MRFSVTYPLASGRASAEFATRRGVVEFARAAEEAGFDGIGFTDHPAPTHRWMTAGGHDALDPFAALAFCAAVTERILLIPNEVVLPYRNPLLVAKSVATIDALSGGRFVLAVGTGYLKGEYRALGVDFDERNALFDEALEVMRGVWTTDDFQYEGRNFTAHGQTANPKPSGPIPIWIGGNSRLSRLKARLLVGPIGELGQLEDASVGVDCDRAGDRGERASVFLGDDGGAVCPSGRRQGGGDRGACRVGRSTSRIHCTVAVAVGGALIDSAGQRRHNVEPFLASVGDRLAAHEP